MKKERYQYSIPLTVSYRLLNQGLMSEPSQLPQAAQPIAAMVLAKLGRGWDGEGLSDVLLSAHSQLHVTEHVNYGHFILQMYMAPRGLSLSA